MKPKKPIITIGILAFSLVMAWAAWPTIVVKSIAFVEPKGEEPSRRACDRIIEVGPRTIQPIIRSLRRHGPWSRRYCYLPIALRELGEPAHEALMQTIDEEVDPLTRTKLISSLQSGFQDFSRLSVVIEDSRTGLIRGYPLFMMSGYIRMMYPDAPPFQVDDPVEGMVNPDFADWWYQKSIQKRHDSGMMPQTFNHKANRTSSVGPVA
ncbi:hypothetical protein P3T73_06975 [Kiritimatiellota bacterium B12222]|nr:hypothetical protein P3T73_06975 [Kiritimatiellota bacterium B12222]